jgi:hypothetical protein
MTEEEVLGLKAPSGVEQSVDKNLEASEVHEHQMQ